MATGCLVLGSLVSVVGRTRMCPPPLKLTFSCTVVARGPLLSTLSPARRTLTAGSFGLPVSLELGSLVLGCGQVSPLPLLVSVCVSSPAVVALDSPSPALISVGVALLFPSVAVPLVLLAVDELAVFIPVGVLLVLGPVWLLLVIGPATLLLVALLVDVPVVFSSPVLGAPEEAGGCVSPLEHEAMKVRTKDPQARRLSLFVCIFVSCIGGNLGGQTPNSHWVNTECVVRNGKATRTGTQVTPCVKVSRHAVRASLPSKSLHTDGRNCGTHAIAQPFSSGSPKRGTLALSGGTVPSAHPTMDHGARLLAPSFEGQGKPDRLVCQEMTFLPLAARDCSHGHSDEERSRVHHQMLSD